MPKKLTRPMKVDRVDVSESLHEVPPTLIRVTKMWTVKCQLGNFEALEITEGVELFSTPEQYAASVKYCEDELVRRLSHTGKLLLNGLVLPTEGRSIAGQLAIRLKDGKVKESV